MNTLLNFFRHYWITAILIFILLTLTRQSFFINEFPFSLYKKQEIIDKNTQENELSKQQNKVKALALKASSASDSEVLESQARYRLGLVKKGERYYQISESIDE